ncbi:tol-pal system-associated acyl-CoA thioesterase [Kozakia baliensis]|uniref:4-hydroxybenzoyl-CoA thioesterase n=1 Tax=Kozakia baliensis TaxID=153496 RepID=A0A1D8URJ9_9PROT|nr:tol-pal system-associated acyl-CoA thioesterase [Kozakia baliensis]AOX16261.1 4-hydroxybenzoyl-CoA thioesterase [Kozakia baliensis]GBR28393.1 4-hydroxybenzoyl-CoA thioesterase [Kozakia baliensis NRIC 0488]GEL63689.1 tol-pal system-associated acyl-CoA thioesterase [Kozakia baliensis]
MKHKIGFRVYYEDTDAGGIVYHARYLAFAERARTEAMRELSASAQEMLAETGLAFVVRRVNAEYRRPLRLDDWMEVETSLLELRAARCRLRQDITCGEMLAVTLNIELACIAQESGRPARIPPRWHVSLNRLVATSED